MVGEGIRVKRYEGCDGNPWLLETKGLTSRPLGIQELFDKKFKIDIELKDVTHAPRPEECTDINCISLLLSKDDSDLTEILNSRLMRFVFSIIITQFNFDAIYDDSYLALLSS